MSNYTKTTNFATKDSLPSGNPAKIVKGTEIDTEFNNIAVAVATKPDTGSISGGTGIDTTPSGTSVSIAIDSTVATLTGTQTLTNKTLNTPAITGALTTNSTIDGRDVATDGTKLDGIEAGADVTDTANVTAAGALMDSEVTNLAEVKAFDSTDYATAAQGAKADAALPTTGGAMTGAITTNSTFDGRDVATDGTKLDGIETGADVTDTTNVVASLSAGTGISLSAGGEIANTAPDQTVALTGAGGTSISGTYPNFTVSSLTGGGETLAQTLILGNTTGGTDLSISSGDNIIMAASSTVDGRDVSVDGTKLDGIEASADVTDTANVTAAGALMDSELTSIASVKALDQGVSTADSPTFAGINVDGEITGPVSNNLNIRSKYSATIDIDSDNNQTDRNFQVIHDGSKLILKAEESGDISFYEDTGTTAKMVWDASEESLGIGTSSPAEKLHVNGTALMFGARMSSNNGSTYWDVKRDISTGHFHIADDSLGNVLTIRQDSGNVGIGTTSPACHFHVEGSGTGSVSDHLRISSTDTQAKLAFVTTEGNSAIYQDGYNLVLANNTANTERMRIDSSGNLLVGTTNANNVSDGIRLKPDGFISAANTSGSVMYANRLSTDGSILSFQKDGSTVGSIGTLSSHVYIGKGDTGIRFIDSLDCVEPFNTSTPTLRDAGIDLGRSSARFKDLHLSGTGYFGTNVGIGTSSPDSILDVVGADPILTIRDTSTSGADSHATLRLAESDGSGNVNIHWDVALDENNLTFDFNNGATTTERMRIDSWGNVGIGTTSPQKSIHVNAGSTNEVARFESTDSTAYLSIMDNSTSTSLQGIGSVGNDLTLYANNAERMRIDESGNVGMGTSSPNYSLHVNEPSDNTARFQITNSSTGTGVGDGFQIIQNGSSQSNKVNLLNYDNSALGIWTNNTERLHITASGNVGVGTSSPGEKLHVTGSLRLDADNSEINLKSGVAGTSGAVNWTFNTDATNYASLKLPYDTRSTTGFLIDSGYPITIDSINGTKFNNNGSEVARIDSSGNLLVGTTDTSLYNNGAGGDTGLVVEPSGTIQLAKSNNICVYLNRLDSDGSILQFRKDGSTVGSIGTNSGNIYLTDGARSLVLDGSVIKAGYSTGGDADNAQDLGSSSVRFKDLHLSGTAHIATDGVLGETAEAGSTFYFSNNNIGLKAYSYITSNRLIPCDEDGANRDNYVDLGQSDARFDDIYATNGTINTSDFNEKQDIAELSDAEQRVAVACKGLLRKFRWKDAVDEKGDEARTHFGIIAQDLQTAFEAEGLDAGNYGMFVSTTWTDEETNEEKTRMGVRYSELLAFIIAAI